MRPLHLAGGVLVLLGSMLCGCVTQSGGDSQQLDQATDALRQKQYDRTISLAGDHLRHDAQGEGAAKAWYLRGRAIDERPKSSQQAVAADLQEARSCYIKALGFMPTGALEANIRNDVANVAYQQEDYTTAEQQWLAACDRFEQPDYQAWALYRAGVCRQRLGKFAEADKLFAEVQQKFPGTEQAKRAAAHIGARSFSVQVASVSTSAAADAIVAALRKAGANAMTQSPRAGQGGFAVVVGPYATYREAEAQKQKFAGQYPEAIVVP